jgi:hypothetical protein
MIAALFVCSQTIVGQSLDVRLDGEQLRVIVNRVRLLSGEPLQKLRDGASVTYVVRLAALSGQAGSVLARADYRFVISYDIFEERFQVSRIQPSPRVMSHLTMAAAESMFFELSELSVRNLPADRPFWIRWECRVEDSAKDTDSTTTLDGLVDLFGRRPTKQPARSVVEAGPFKLSTLPRQTPSR